MSKRSAYRIAPYEPGALRAVCALQNLLWRGGIEGNRRYFDWKYRQNPYLDDRFVVLAWHGDRLVGMIGAFGACWSFPNGTVQMLPCVADTVIVPELRGTSLFFDMLDCLVDRLRNDGLSWLLDFGDQPAGPAMIMRGWVAIGPWAIATHVRSHKPTGAISGATLGRRSGTDITGIQSPGWSAMTALNTLAVRGGSISHVREERYLRWRLANPLARHWLFKAGPDGSRGYLLAHRTATDRDEGPTPTTILDCEADDDNVWIDMLDRALDAVPGQHVNIWTRDLPQSRIDLLQGLGMANQCPSGRLTRDTHLPNLLVFRTGSHTESVQVLDASAWDLRSICGRSWR